MTVAVTGAAGFAGRHVVAAARAAGHEVLAIGHRVAPPAGPGITVALADVREADAMAALFARHRPAAVVHLAGFPWPGRSVEQPRAALEANVLGTLGVLEAVRRTAPDARVLLVGSADEYGDVPAADLPLREDRPLAPRTPYAVSKSAATALGLAYQRSLGMAVVATRSFNHTGPGQPRGFVCPDFAAQIVDAERAGGGELRVGDPAIVRDFGDVRDVARAYLALLARGVPGRVYNVCTGRPVRVGEIAERLAGLARAPVRVVHDPSRARPRPWDCAALVGDPARLRADTGFTPAIPLETTLRDLLDGLRCTPLAD